MSTFSVTSTLDSGAGSLRQAIVDANAAGTGTAASPDLIQFNIPTTDPGYQSGTGSFPIRPLSALPTVTDTVVIDGYTEPGASPNTLVIGDNAVLKIVLDGSLAGAVDGLVIAGGNSTVRGLVIDNFAYGIGVVLKGDSYDIVVGNFIGADVTGTSAAPNYVGIETNPIAPVTSIGETIGGTAPQDRNIVSGNSHQGIFVDNGNLIQGNYIGTDKNGTAALDNMTGIAVGSNNTIGGLTGTPGTGAGNLIAGNTEGIHLNANQNLVEGNLIGTNATGQTALGNGQGIHIIGTNNTVGGTTAGARNIISGSNSPFGGTGINIEALGSGGAQYNLVQGNYIGTDITGTIGLGIQNGIGIGGAAAAYNTIGGTTAAARNIISGNVTGIVLTNGSGSFGNVIQGNYIGTDPRGTQVVGQGHKAIWLQVGNHDNTIGGTVAGACNVISGQGQDVIEIAGASGNLIQGNLIGTDKTGTVALGNGAGITIFNSGTNGANNNTIGGTTPGAANTIAFSSRTGVEVDSGTGNSILGNSIHDNAGPGILLNSANNANDNQVAPVLSGASSSSSGMTINGTLQSVANTTFRIEFFDNQSPDPSGYGEGQTYLGFATVTTDGSGHATFKATGLAALPTGQRYLSATATNVSTGDTSEFSQDLFIPFNFSGFLPPLSNNMAFGLNRTIPIKFQLHDFDGSLITALSAVTSLQIQALDATGHPVGSPFNPTPTGRTALRNDGSQYVFNWQTKGLAAGNYEILLTLADGTVQTKVLQLTKSGSSSGLTTVAAGGTGSAPGGVLGGNIDLYVDNSNGDLTADELARVQDAVTAVDAVTVPYGVAVAEVADPTQANVTLNMDTTSAVGSYSSGVLGCTTDAGQITIIAGWNFYAGASATQIGSAQFDFETVVIHELGHALGLGHSANSASVMFATLNVGTANRALAVADLNVPDTGTGACGLHAAPVPSVGADFLGAGPSSGASTTISGYQDQGNSVSIKQAALNAVLAGRASTVDKAAEIAHILDDGAPKGLWNRIGLRPFNEQDQFWSDIDGEPILPRIIGLSGDVG